jgi:hypothetical protein
MKLVFMQKRKDTLRITGVCQQCGEKYLTAKVAKEIEQRILTKEKWDKTISVPVDVFPEEIAV